jgi:molybdate transport system substrate-binding protein
MSGHANDPFFIQYIPENITLAIREAPIYLGKYFGVYRRLDMGIHRRHWIKMTVAALAVAWLGIIPLAGSAQAAEKVTVFAAASLKNALDDITAAWQKESGKEAAISYAASSALAKQIESGAPADIFISADLDWMDYVAKKNLIKADTRKNLLGNRIVLVASKDKAEPVEIKKGFDLAKLLGEGRLAMGAVDSVPAGKYGKAALESLGVWSSVEGKVAGAESVRAALLLVSRGEAPHGIVYQTDAAADKEVKIVGTFPEDSHPPIIYPIAILSDSKNADAVSLFDYIKSEKAVPFFEKQGFTVLK